MSLDKSYVIGAKKLEEKKDEDRVPGVKTDLKGIKSTSLDINSLVYVSYC